MTVDSVDASLDICSLAGQNATVADMSPMTIHRHMHSGTCNVSMGLVFSESSQKTHIYTHVYTQVCNRWCTRECETI